MLLTEAIEALLIATRADGRSTETVKAYRRKLKPLVVFLGDVPVEGITCNDIRLYVAHLMDRPTRYADHPMHEEVEGGLSPFTVASHVRAVKRLFNWLEDEGGIKTNPTRRIKTPRPKRREPKAIGLQNFLKLLATTESGSVADLRDRAILLFLADTGCRVGGLCGLRVQDLDLGAGLAVITEKGDKARLVPFNPPAAEALRAWLAVRPEDQGPWVFVSVSTNVRGGLTTSGVIQMLKRRAKKADVTGAVNPHAFRHFFAREFLMNGGDLATLADLLGHSSVEVTKASYAIFTVQELKEKHRRHSPVARLLGGGENGRAGNS
jgi:site-specific recombinase XerD